MSVLFDRIATLTIGASEKEGRLFDGFRINFTVTKDLKSDANTGKISIYNLNSDSIGLIEKKDQIAILEVGYKGMPTVIPTLDGPKVVYKPLTEILSTGNIKNVSTKTQGADKITTFEIGDGEEKLNNSLVNKSFPPNTDSKTIINELVDGLGLIKGAVTEATGFVFESGLTLEGKTKDRLGEVLDKADLSFSVQDGEVQIIKKGGSTNEGAILLTPETGLVGSPTRKLIKKDDGTTVEGVDCSALLNPKIKPARKIIVKSRQIDGTFTVQKATYTGDTNQGNFTCKLEAL